MSAADAPAGACIVLPGFFTQPQLAALKTMVEQRLAEKAPIIFDAAEIERIDGAAVQFLLGVSQLHKQNQQSEPLVVNAAEIVEKALSDMGVTDEIMVTDAGMPAEQKAA